MKEIGAFLFVCGLVAITVAYIHARPPHKKDHDWKYNSTVYLGNGGLLIVYRRRRNGVQEFQWDNISPDGVNLGSSPIYLRLPAFQGGVYKGIANEPSDAEKHKKADPMDNDAPPA